MPDHYIFRMLYSRGVSLDKLGIPQDIAIRVNLASAGVWWLTFSFFTWARLHPRHARKPLPAGETYTSVGFRQLRQTMREIGRFPETLKFLGRFLDGYVLSLDAIFFRLQHDGGGDGHPWGDSDSFLYLHGSNTR